MEIFNSEDDRNCSKMGQVRRSKIAQLFLIFNSFNFHTKPKCLYIVCLPLLKPVTMQIKTATNSLFDFDCLTYTIRGAQV